MSAARRDVGFTAGVGGPQTRRGNFRQTPRLDPDGRKPAAMLIEVERPLPYLFQSKLAMLGALKPYQQVMVTPQIGGYLRRTRRTLGLHLFATAISRQAVSMQ